MQTLIKYFTYLLLFLFTTGTTYAARPFIIDTDVGVDDAIAILYLLQRSDIQIKAITIESDGNAHCKPALYNTLGLLQMMQQPTIPVACGQEKPMFGRHHFPAIVLKESDTLANTAKLLSATHSNTQQNAVDLLIKTIKTTSQPITILAIGPLTNIAQALQKAPAIKNHIQAIYIMGGAIHVPGNIPEVNPAINNQTAEWNIYLDPLAANIVLTQEIPIILVPLDVTNQLPIDMNFYNAVKHNHHSPAAQYVFMLLKNNLKLLRAKEWYFWDPLAAVIASDASIAHFQMQGVKIILTPETQSGTTAIDNNQKHKIRILTQVDQKRFQTLLLNDFLTRQN